MKIDINLAKFRAPEGGKIKLKKWATCIPPIYESKDDYCRMIQRHVERLSEMQSLLYAHHRYSLLLIFQAMDAAGKDSAIKHVMSGVNPQGCQVFSFKHPSLEELSHDFLWRAARALPERGRIGIFNRSYYEEVLIVRVHREILEAEALPESVGKPAEIWKSRFHSIRDFEAHLARNGTRIIKFFLHISKEEQRKRFLARIDEPDKNWKFSIDDLKERRLWKEYMHAYESCISETSTDEAPWFIVPADDKKNARLIISEAILEALEGLKLKYPRSSGAHQKELAVIRKLLEDEQQ